ncbi:MAG: hypothetical protein A2469_04300 [Candidatus Magasanikbacteria bacterium RIFOXYC2_FULL_40_16]|uniref:Pentapeptide repeat protein n=2 Tax=Candidatus Magasanikiibacteriota TaxID=1752731 RepID=A0A1F6NZ82_9BACT|nr:MAG: hypothetical protein A2224_01920 [Candidatus Magasanikbacteria bacterium RIFOXYA2_FULL_40_20]OGH87307.1 MAG: hypothetical protein A2206_03170 [Candidatus Magasanikbacteria bacterium RIFOXYA1_FULL_40_8]OGH89219.1 MAG: hypothetical protein A2469_04300 [Candidatus Magasanikbacteria bacterium RIFOXYC2_FULL_40_16]
MTKKKTKEYLLSLGVPGLTEDRFNRIYWDLCNLNLSGRDLSGLKLYNCDFRGTNLNDANLSESDCRGGYFDKNTTLHRANLSDANFDFSNCQGADFSGAKILRTSFKDVKYENADFLNTDIGRYKKNQLKIAKAQVYKRPIIGTPFQVAVSKTSEAIKNTARTLKFYVYRFFL